MRSIRRQLFLALLMLSLLAACDPLKDVGKGLGDLLKGLTSGLR